MLHHHHDLLDPGDEVHGAAHALHHLARDHPVGEVAVLGHLHGAQERDVDMAAADHGEGIGGGEIAGGGDLGDGLLSRIDEVGILLALVGEGPEAEHAVLALELHAHAVRYVIRHQGRDADAEIDIETVAQLLGGARGHLVATPGHQTSTPVAAAATRLRTVRCSMCFLALGTWMRRCTKTPGVTMWSGLICPGSNRVSTSATVTLPAVAIIGLKLRAVLR